MTSSYQQQLDAKVERISAQFAEYQPPALEVFESPEQYYRMRAEFRIWHTEDDLFYAMFERDENNNKKVIRIDEFPGGNQSLSMRIKGEKTTLSLTIQTELMRKAARFGVVLGENAPQACRSAIQASMQNLNVLVDGDCAKTTFNELLDYLHQEKIWVYTPHGQLHELPQGATVVDFAYSASLFLGNHAVGAKINGDTKPLSTPLSSGQVIEVITDVLASPNPDWLSFINTQKARRAIQNILRDQDIDEQRMVGEQALNRALKLFNRSIQDLTDADWANILQWRHIPNQERLYEQIAVGDLLPQLVANHLFAQDAETGSNSTRLIQGTEGVDVKYAHCCNPDDRPVDHRQRLQWWCGSNGQYHLLPGR